MKKVFMGVSIACMVLAVVFLTLSLLPEEPSLRVSKMNDQQLQSFLLKYDLDGYNESSDLKQIRIWASHFEKTGLIDQRMENAHDPFGPIMIPRFWIELTNALADYYNRPQDAYKPDLVG